MTVVVPATYIQEKSLCKYNNYRAYNHAFQFDINIFVADNTLPDLPQHLKTFFLLRAIFAVPANRASARIVDVAVASYNVLGPVYDHSDIVCADDIVFELELVVVVRYEEVYSAAAFASINN